MCRIIRLLGKRSIAIMSEGIYKFYGNENVSQIIAKDNKYSVNTPIDLYERLLKIWSADTCAPRLRADWSPANPTLGQCSITAFLAQDIFGGQVYAVKTGNGVHCYNVVDGVSFDLTSEQFGERAKELDYTPVLLQNREAPNHFGNGEKRNRYELLRSGLSNC